MRAYWFAVLLPVMAALTGCAVTAAQQQQQEVKRRATVERALTACRSLEAPPARDACTMRVWQSTSQPSSNRGPEIGRGGSPSLCRQDGGTYDEHTSTCYKPPRKIPLNCQTQLTAGGWDTTCY